MKKILTILLMGLVSGCAHKSIHEKCSDAEILGHYRDYDQCYAEESASRKERQQRWAHAFKNMGKQTNCTTTSWNGTASTQCY